MTNEDQYRDIYWKIWEEISTLQWIHHSPWRYSEVIVDTQGGILQALDAINQQWVERVLPIGENGKTEQRALKEAINARFPKAEILYV